MNGIRSTLVVARDAVRAGVGYVNFRRTGATTRSAELGLRGVFTYDPRLPSRVSRLAHRSRADYVRPTSGLLGNLDRVDVAETAAALDRDGCYRFQRLLPEDMVRELDELSAELAATPRSTPASDTESNRADAARLRSTRYDYAPQQLMQNQLVQRVAFDPSFAAIADAYLRCDAALAGVAMWRSVPFGDEPSSAAAQLFHADRDYPQFLKIFIYLTDVTPESGPHVYVRTSHCHRPRPLRRDVRFHDDEVRASYRDEIEELCGSAGTILAADTRGLHKGKAPEHGERLILQLQFASSFFGTNAPEIILRNSEAAVEARLRSEPARYRRFRLDRGQ